MNGVEFPVAVLRRGPTGNPCTEPELRFVESLELSFVVDYRAGAPLTAREGPSPPDIVFYHTHAATWSCWVSWNSEQTVQITVCPEFVENNKLGPIKSLCTEHELKDFPENAEDTAANYASLATDDPTRLEDSRS